MKKKRIFKRILVFIAVLVGTLGICSVSGSIAKAASTDGMNREFLIMNAGTHVAQRTEPGFEGIFEDTLIPLVFDHEDENTGAITRYKSIYVEYRENNYYAYFNPSDTELAADAVMFANSISSDWLMSITITTYKKQIIVEEGYEFLLNNYGPSSVETQYLISGRYEFNDGVIENTFRRIMHEEVFNVRGYFASPLMFTKEELEGYFDVSGLRAGEYYISSFRNIRLSAANTTSFDSIEFECYVPAANIWVWINVIDESTDELADWANVNTVIFDGAQYVNPTFFNFLDTNGYFGPPIFTNDDTYTATDLIFAVVDAPIRFIQSLMSFELFGMGFFIIFASIITIGIGLWFLFKK